jgi:hypothetical protein
MQIVEKENRGKIVMDLDDLATDADEDIDEDEIIYLDKFNRLFQDEDLNK